MSLPNFNRDYGLPDSEVIGTPFATELRLTNTAVCPNCGCEQLMHVTVKVIQKLLKTPTGTGTYLGCPACPYASPMVVTAAQPKK